MLNCRVKIGSHEAQCKNGFSSNPNGMGFIWKWRIEDGLTQNIQTSTEKDQVSQVIQVIDAEPCLKCSQLSGELIKITDSQISTTKILLMRCRISIFSYPL